MPEDFYNHHEGSAVERTEALRRLMLSSDKFYGNWAPQLKTILTNAEGPFCAWTLNHLKAEEVGWKRDVAPGVTLLGDAAHLSTPFVGEGVNCAMQDSLLLAECLFEIPKRGLGLESVQVAGLEKALASYEVGMFERGQDLIRHSAESEAVPFSENSVH